MPYNIFSINNFISKKTPGRVAVFLFLVGILLTGGVALAAYDKYAPGEVVTIGEFVYDDTFVATTTACTTTVYSPNPAHTLVVEAAMTPSTTGWHEYSFTPSPIEGLWSASMYCGTSAGGDLSRLDKSFVIGYNGVSTTPIASAVWNNTGRTLSDYATSSIVDSIWNVATSTLSTVGSIGKQIVTNLNGTISGIAGSVWGNVTRLLTGKTLTDPGEGNIATESYIDTATTTIISKIETASTSVYNSLMGSLNNISAFDVWDYAGRDLDRPTIVTASTSAAVWAVATSSLSNSGSVGKLIVDNLDEKISTRGTSMLTAANIWEYTGRTLTDYATSSITTAIWDYTNKSLNNYGNQITALDVWNALSADINLADSIGRQLKENSDAKISSIADSVWLTSSNRTLSDYSTTSIASAVWESNDRTLSSFGSLVSNIWSDVTAPNRQLTTSTIVGGSILATENYLTSSLSTVSSSINSQILQNRSLISGLNNISAYDVWHEAGRDLDNPSVVIASTSEAVWERTSASLVNAGTIGKLFVDNIDAKISTRSTSTLTAADIWEAGTRTLTDYSTTSIALSVCGNAARELTNYGTQITAADVWNVLTSTISTVDSIGKKLVDNIDVPISTRATLTAQQAGRMVNMSDVGSVVSGQTYRAKIYITNIEGVPQDAVSAPLVTVYDASRNLKAENISASWVSTGVYSYTYTIEPLAAGGLWETAVSTQVASGAVVQTNDYWVVESSPAHVAVNYVTDDGGTSVTANITIINEGVKWYEYDYVWCVVTSMDNACDGANDVAYGSGAKLLLAREVWNKDINAVVPSNGVYFFKLRVYFNTDHSDGSSMFTLSRGVITPPVEPPRGGGGGGGVVSPPALVPVAPTTTTQICNSADFNHDKKVNSTDFSILLAFWKTSPPFRNHCVDTNKDQKVNSVDFSILMYEWGSKK